MATYENHRKPNRPITRCFLKIYSTHQNFSLSANADGPFNCKMAEIKPVGVLIHHKLFHYM